MNEALTEWITQRLARELYGTLHREWRGLVLVSCYPAWIIEMVVQALESQWGCLRAAVPALSSHQIVQASDLFYVLCFRDAQGLVWLKEALEQLSGQVDACETVARACRWFALPRPRQIVPLFQSWEALSQWLVPFLPEEMTIPAEFAVSGDEVSDTLPVLGQEEEKKEDHGA
jgi:hypothetical protein